jgi:Uma2 family endonuclease
MSQVVTVSIEEYMRRAEASLDKLEYYDGKIVAMAGATLSHVRINGNLIRELGNRLRGTSCEAFGSDLRVAVPNVASYSYPDLSIVCGPLELDPRDKSGKSITNPRVLIEILSPSTERFDRGLKFERYLKLESLEEYLLVSQAEARVESFLRSNDGTWSFAFVNGLAANAVIRSLKLELPMAEIFRNVVFPPPEQLEGLENAHQ